MHKAFFNKTNVAIMAVAIALLIVGYWLLATPPVDGFLSLTVSPLILVFTYLFVVPAAILWSGKTEKSGD